MIPFGKQLHTTRTALRMTQDDLALELGVDKQTVSNWECERTQPWPNKKVEVLTRLLNLTSDAQLERCYVEALSNPPQINYVPAPVRARVIDRI